MLKQQGEGPCHVVHMPLRQQRFRKKQGTFVKRQGKARTKRCGERWHSPFTSEELCPLMPKYCISAQILVFSVTTSERVSGVLWLGPLRRHLQSRLSGSHKAPADPSNWVSLRNDGNAPAQAFANPVLKKRFSNIWPRLYRPCRLRSCACRHSHVSSPLTCQACPCCCSVTTPAAGTLQPLP